MNKRPCCFVPTARPAKKPARKAVREGFLPEQAIHIDPVDSMDSQGSVRAVGEKRTGKGRNAMRMDPMAATLSP